MKIELCLSLIEGRRWVGLAKIDEEIVKVMLFPGSAVSDWEASIQPTLFCELDSEKAIFKAIEKEWRRLGQNVTQPQPNPDSLMDAFEMLKGNEEAMVDLIKLITRRSDGRVKEG